MEHFIADYVSACIFYYCMLRANDRSEPASVERCQSSWIYSQSVCCEHQLSVCPCVRLFIYKDACMLLLLRTTTHIRLISDLRSWVYYFRGASPFLIIFSSLPRMSMCALEIINFTIASLLRTLFDLFLLNELCELFAHMHSGK